MSRPMQGAITYLYDPKIRTPCTTALKNLRANLVLAPPFTIVLEKRAQIFRAFCMFPTTYSQLSSESVKMRPNYLKDITVSSGLN